MEGTHFNKTASLSSLLSVPGEVLMGPRCMNRSLTPGEHHACIIHLEPRPYPHSDPT